MVANTLGEKALHQKNQVLLGAQGQGGTSVYRRQENNQEQ